MNVKVTDLCDEFQGKISIASPGFRDFGGVKAFGGQIVTVDVFEDNTLVRQALSEDGTGKVLVVDGKASLNCALLGDQVANLARDNHWAGIIVNGCVRDTAELKQVAIGIKALAAHPKKSRKEGKGARGVPVSFCGIMFQQGEFVYADEDGVIVAAQDLTNY